VTRDYTVSQERREAGVSKIRFDDDVMDVNYLVVYSLIHYTYYVNGNFSRH
jgi:hypothetical protein